MAKLGGPRARPRRSRTMRVYRPFLFFGFVAGVGLAATGHPWWEFVAMWLAAFQLTVSD